MVSQVDIWKEICDRLGGGKLMKILFYQDYFIVVLFVEWNVILEFVYIVIVDVV